MTTDADCRLDRATPEAAVEDSRAGPRRDTVPGLAVVPDGRLDDALRAMADLLGRRAAEVLEANAEDVRAAEADGIRRTRCWTGCGWTRPGWRPSPASSARWPTSRPSRPAGRSGSCPAACGWRSAAGRSA